MYHYLKWAALGLFFRRNVRYLALIAGAVAGIVLADAIYTDLADLAVKTDRTDRIVWYLAGKWIAVLLCGGLILYAIGRLGFSSDEGKKRETKSKPASPPEPEDPVMKRLEKFKHPDRLRHRSDLIIARRKRK